MLISGEGTCWLYFTLNTYTLASIIYNTLPFPFTDSKRLITKRFGGLNVKTAGDQCTGKVWIAGPLGGHFRITWQHTRGPELQRCAYVKRFRYKSFRTLACSVDALFADVEDDATKIIEKPLVFTLRLNRRSRGFKAVRVSGKRKSHREMIPCISMLPQIVLWLQCGLHDCCCGSSQSNIRELGWLQGRPPVIVGMKNFLRKLHQLNYTVNDVGLSLVA